MLKKIPTAELRLGMYLQGFEGAWVDHPFWRTRFLLDDAADLEKVRRSGVVECWIDSARGRDIDEPSAEGASSHDAGAPASAAPLPAAAGAQGAEPPPPTATMAEELARAASVCHEARQAVTKMFNEARLGLAVDAERCLPLVAEISNSVFRHPGALVSLARLKTRDDYTYMHSVAVCALMVALGRQSGLDEAGCREAGLAGLLHDLGKSQMPLDVLHKPGPLTEHEFAVMKTHPARGHEMLVEGKGASAGALDVCLHHHERIDGSGYPNRLAGNRISRFARMGAICDVYDAVTSDRPYKAGWDPALTISRMASWKGHFDEVLFQHFVKSLGIYPVGSLVRLESQQLAVVVDQSTASLVAPVVRTFFSVKTRTHVFPVRLDLSRPSCADRIVGREMPEQWKFPALEQLWVGSGSRGRAA